MLISKENTGKSKYTLWNFILFARLPGNPRDEKARWKMKRTRHCKEEAAKRKGHRLALLSQPLFTLSGGERFTIVKLVVTILSSMDSILLRLSSKQPVYRSHQRSPMINDIINFKFMQEIIKFFSFPSANSTFYTFSAYKETPLHILSIIVISLTNARIRSFVWSVDV